VRWSSTRRASPINTRGKSRHPRELSPRRGWRRVRPLCASFPQGSLRPSRRQRNRTGWLRLGVSLRQPPHSGLHRGTNVFHAECRAHGLPRFAARQFPIGSDAAESARKGIAQARLKQARMRWRVAGGHAVASTYALPLLRALGRFLADAAPSPSPRPDGTSDSAPCSSPALPKRNYLEVHRDDYANVSTEVGEEQAPQLTPSNGLITLKASAPPHERRGLGSLEMVGATPLVCVVSVERGSLGVCRVWDNEKMLQASASSARRDKKREEPGATETVCWV